MIEWIKLEKGTVLPPRGEKVLIFIGGEIRYQELNYSIDEFGDNRVGPNFTHFARVQLPTESEGFKVSEIVLTCGCKVEPFSTGSFQITYCGGHNNFFFYTVKPGYGGVDVFSPDDDQEEDDEQTGEGE